MQANKQYFASAPIAAPAEPVDILIAGGGPVGVALALALEASGLAVVLAEARSAAALDPAAKADAGGASRDARALALSYGSRLILERLHAWPRKAATPIQTIHVSQRGGFGRTLISAADYGLPALGYVADYDELLRALQAAPCSATRIYGAKLGAFDGATAVLRGAEGERRFAPKLLVFADGAHMAEDDSAYRKDYGQTAVVAWVKAREAHRGRAWERFTPEGPLALLPHGAGYSLVWTTDPDNAARLCAADDAAFLAELHAAFGDRLGAFVQTSARAAFPLALSYRREEAEPRSVSIGNASQTLHPVAGQGFNLGLRDAWELARLARTASELGSEEFLRAYRRTRMLDRRAGIRFTDTLVGLFSNANPLLRVGRGMGLLALDLVPAAREFVARRMIYGARALP